MTKSNLEDYAKLLKTKGWDLITDEDSLPTQDLTLEEQLRAAHNQKKSGKKPGTIKNIENAIELGLIEMEQLWDHLGLPK
ncbi:MAG: hypothetical protein WAO98_04160 [Alphaproteobacteria bacterium]